MAALGSAASTLDRVEAADMGATAEVGAPRSERLRPIGGIPPPASYADAAATTASSRMRSSLSPASSSVSYHDELRLLTKRGGHGQVEHVLWSARRGRPPTVSGSRSLRPRVWSSADQRSVDPDDREIDLASAANAVSASTIATSARVDIRSSTRSSNSLG